MSKLIFNVHENYIEIAKVTKIFTLVKIKNIVCFTPQDDIEANAIDLKRIFRKNKLKSKNVEVILSIDGIITRQIETAALKQTDLKNYIHNNISQYFTVNTRDFYFDYKIVAIKTVEKKKIFSVLLVAVPKEKLDKIKLLLKLNKLTLAKVKIYPECIASYYKKNKKQSIAVLDVGNEKCSITLIDKGSIFIHSTLSLDLSDIDGYNELMDNFSYFLNFYSTRNFGKKIDKIYTVGEKSEEDHLINTLSEATDIPITYENANHYIEILGSCMDVKAIYNKYIDFKATLKNKSVENNKPFVFAAILIVLVAVGGLGGYYYYSNTYLPKIPKIDSLTLQVEIGKYSDVEKTITTLNIEKQDYQSKIAVITGIKNDFFDYISIIDGLKKGLPKNVTLKSLEIQVDTAKVTLNINKNTLDVARAAIAINKTKLFETIDIDQIKLDDTVDSISFSLKIKKPS